jgi:hypothetical protein
MVLTDSRSLAGVLRTVAERYVVPIAATNGHVGGFLHTGVGPRLVPGQRVLYLGDLDLSGDQIEANTRRVLEEITGDGLRWVRIALTAAQAERYQLPGRATRRRASRRPARLAHVLGVPTNTRLPRLT